MTALQYGVLVILLDGMLFPETCILRCVLFGCYLSTRNSMATYLVSIHLAF